MQRAGIGSHPLVSVIMIFLNAKAFMAEAIASVFGQTYPRWELLLIDDGSSDASTAIARSYHECSSDRVRYLEHPGHLNRGMSASRNLGLSQARGDYIAFLDADDVWFPHTLEQQVATLSTHPAAGMVFGATEYWYSWTGNPEDNARDSCDFCNGSGGKLNTLLTPPEYLIRFLEDTSALPGICSLMARRTVVEAVGGFEEQFRSLHEDQAFLAKMALHTPIYMAEHRWAHYRRHPNSTCAVAERNGQVPAANAFFLNWLSSYLRKHNVNDSRVWAALQKYH
jgi:glycosyltransferase involved in cell wall biosynthesis